MITKNENKGSLIHDIRVGDRVQLMQRRGGYETGSTEYPMQGTSYACDGTVVDIPDEGNRGVANRFVVSIEWDSGYIDYYLAKDLALAVHEDIVTRSVVILNQDIKIGDFTIIKKGVRMYSQGDFIHDAEGKVYVKICDDIEKRKYLSKKINK